VVKKETCEPLVETFVHMYSKQREELAKSYPPKKSSEWE